MRRPAGAAPRYRADPSTYQAAVARLRPGDTVELEAGVYPGGLALHDVRGAPGAPITITGPATGARAVFPARDGAHTVSLMDSAHVVLRRLELDGRHKAVDGVKAEGQGPRRCVAVHDVVLDDLYIHDHDHDQQTVAINAKCTAWNWTVRRTVIERAGTGMYFGGSRGDTPFFRGVLEHNLVTDTLGYSLQIKHQRGRPDLTAAPRDPGPTVIRHNVFVKAGPPRPARDARPNVLVGHAPPTGPGSEDGCEIYGNFFYQNPGGEPLFQGEGNVALYSNLFVNRHGDAVRIEPHHDRPRRVHVFWNTVLAARDGIRVTGADPRCPQVVAGNAVFAGRTPIRGRAPGDNVVDRYDRAPEHLAAPAGEPGALDLAPRPGRLEGPALDVAPFQRFSDWERDVEGRLRDGTVRGAYRGAAARWRPLIALKLEPPPAALVPPPAPDAPRDGAGAPR